MEVCPCVPCPRNAGPVATDCASVKSPTEAYAQISSSPRTSPEPLSSQCAVLAHDRGKPITLHPTVLLLRTFPFESILAPLSCCVAGSHRAMENSEGDYRTMDAFCPLPRMVVALTPCVVIAEMRIPLAVRSRPRRRILCPVILDEVRSFFLCCITFRQGTSAIASHAFDACAMAAPWLYVTASPDSHV